MYVKNDGPRNMSETDDVKAVPEKVVREWELSEPYLVRDISEDGLDDSNRTGGQARSDSIASQLSCSLRSRTSVIKPPEGLHPVLLSGILVNYLSSGYILLPWGKLRPSSVPSTTVHGPSASHHSLFFVQPLHRAAHYYHAWCWHSLPFSRS